MVEMDEPLRPSGSVRVRRGTVSNRPSLPPSFQPPSPPSLPSNSSPPLSSSAPTGSNSPLTQQGSLQVGGGSTRRRRAQTITQRLFADQAAYQPLPASGENDAETGLEPGASGEQVPRGRSPSLSSEAAHGVAPVSVSIPVRRSLDDPNRVRSGTLGSGRRRGWSVGSRAGDELHHGQDEVDLLEVLDQSVSTTATLTNIQSAFIPNFFTRQPVVELQPVTPIEEEPELQLTETGHPVEEVEEIDALDAHLAKLMKKQKRKEKAKEVWIGIKTFIKTPMGIFFLIYGVLVVIWGASLVFFLIIPFNSYRKKLWVEIGSQILTGLFTITSLLPLPWRVFDWWNIAVIWHYARVTRKRRQAQGLAPLRDPNDLPDPPEADFWVGAGGEKMKGPRPPTVPIPPKAPKVKKTKHHANGSGNGTPAEPITPPVELAVLESKIENCEAEREVEIVVLTEKEENRLRKAQIKFSRSQTWYRPHTTPTHHASRISWAVWFTILMVGNSVFQALLCGVMWGLNRWDRPAWTTGCLIPLSFGCGIGAAVLIWQSGEKTKRKAEVTRAVWLLLKADEEKLEARRKQAAAEREAAKAAKKAAHDHHHKISFTHHHSATGSTAHLAGPNGSTANLVKGNSVGEA